MNYGNYGYNSYMGYQPQYQQSYRPQNVEQPFQIVKFVNETEANGFIVEPNCRVLLIDKANKKFWIKWADAMGQSQQEVYKFETLSNTNTIEYVTKNDLTDFITKADLKDIETKLEELQGLIKK